MNTPPPEAKTEYSRGQGDSRARAGIDWRRLKRARGEVDRGWSSALSIGVFAAGLLAALLLVIAEFTTLFTIATSASSQPIKTVSTGSHDTYALNPIALVAVALAYGAAVGGSRSALLALGALGVVTLLIALIGDLPDAQASGVIGNGITRFTTASASPSTGLYLETLGAIVLIIASGCGLLLGRSPGEPKAPPARRPRQQQPPPATREPPPRTRQR